MTADLNPALPANARRWLALLAWVGLCVSIGVVIGLLFKPGTWYAGLEKPAAWLLAPYLAWVSFATLLNVTLLALNGKF